MVMGEFQSGQSVSRLNSMRSLERLIRRGKSLSFVDISGSAHGFIHSLNTDGEFRAVPGSVLETLWPWQKRAVPFGGELKGGAGSVPLTPGPAPHLNLD